MRTRVRFVGQFTVRTKSDHDALFVDVELIRGRGRRRKVVRLRLCTANMGGHFDELDLEKLLEHEPGVIAFQEASDQHWLLDAAAEAGLQLLEGEPGNQVGQAATPTFVGRRVDVRRRGTWVKLLGAVPIGPGAGRRTSKPKWWLKTRLSIEGIRFKASSWHATTSQQFRGRYLAALTEVRIWTAIALTLRLPAFTLGDTNSDFQQKLTRWILDHHMTSNHEQLGEIATMGHRSIDSIAVQRHLVVKRRAAA